MTLSQDFDTLKKCVPTEEDFKTVLDAKTHGKMLWLDSTKLVSPNPQEGQEVLCLGVRRLMAAMLLDWPILVERIKKSLTETYWRNHLTVNQLLSITKALSSGQFVSMYLDNYHKYAALNVVYPEILAKQEWEKRKSEIEYNIKNQNAPYFQVITYYLKEFTELDPTKKITGIRCHIFFGKKIGNTYKIVVRGATVNDKLQSDVPLFATIQEAKDFIAKFKQNPMQSEADFTSWRYVISDKQIEVDRNSITDLSNAVKVNTECGPAYICKISQMYKENLKGQLNMNILNESTLNYSEQLRKMQQLNNGTRGFNVGAASREKIRYNYSICVEEGLTEAKAFIENELKKIYGDLDMIADLMPVSLPKFTVNDFHYADYAFVRDNPVTSLTGKNIRTTFLYLIYAMLQRKANYVDILKNELVRVHNVTLYKIKKIVEEILANQDIKDVLYQIVNFKEKQDEGLDEGTEKIKDGKWVNEGKKGTHGTFKTKKAADAQRKAMFANGYLENFSEEDFSKLVEILNDPKYNDVKNYLKNISSKEDLEEKVEKHDILNPLLFDTNNKLLPEVREKLLAIAKEFTDGLEKDEIKFNLKDIKIVGSNCSYNYNENSDLDLHLVAETESLNCPDNLYPLLYSAYRSIFNNKFDPIIKGIPVELFVETEETEQIDNNKITEERKTSALNSAGIYSVLNDEWIKEPVVADIPEIDQAELDKLVQPWIDKYNAIKANPTVEDIYEVRKEGIAESEYSLKNLTFKEIRGLGYLDDLKTLKNALKSKELSLESLEERLDDSVRRDYQIEISRIAHNQVLIDSNNNFTINLVKESDVDNILRQLRQLDYVEKLDKIAGKFDFSHPVFTGLQPRYWTIRGRIKEKEDL